MESTGLSFPQAYLNLSLIQDSESSVSAKFVTCPACNGIVWEPIQAKCGNLFCERCYNYYIKSKLTCPKHPNQPLIKNKNITENDSILNQIFQSIKLKCKNHNEGCQSILFYNELKNHLENECLYQEIFCPNNCDIVIYKKDLDEHLKNCRNRKINCEECGQEYIIKDEEFHKNNCPKSLIKCDNGCGKKIPRDQLEKHKKDECPKTKISCKFCGDNFEREKFREHNYEYEEKHFTIFYNYFNKLKENYENMNKKVENISVNIQKFQFPSKKFNELEARINQNEKKINENNFPYLFNELNKKYEIMSAQVEKLQNLKTNHQQEESIIINDDKNQFVNKKKIRKTSDKYDNYNSINNNQKNQNEMNKNYNKNDITTIDITNNNNTLNLISNNTDSKKDSSISSKSSSLNSSDKNTTQNKISKSNSLSEKQINNEIENDNNLYLNENELFDKNFKGPNLKILNTSVMSEYMGNTNYHQFAFGSFLLENNKTSYHFVYKINLAPVNLPWVAVGLCDKQYVIQNKYKFKDNENGFFGVSTNGKQWNSNKKKEFCKSFTDFKNVDEQIIKVTFDYEPSEKILKFNYNNMYSDILHDVYAKQSRGLTFCIVFFNSGEIVELIYNGIN